MKSPRLDLLVLRIQLAIMRLGWANCLAIGACIVGLSVWLWGIPYLRAEVVSQQAALSRARQALQAESAPTPELQRSSADERLAHFYDALGEKAYAEQQIRTMFAVASKNALILNQADYKLAHDKNGRYYTYQIDLPVKGPYSAIRQFCTQVLLAIPFASLDEINFKRDGIANRTLEAKLRFTLYLMAPAEQTMPAVDEKDPRS